jgi:hypothetical protein
MLKSTETGMKSAARNLMLLLVPLTLAGCISDTASYMIDGDRNHAVIVSRSQKWFWSDKVSITVLATRQPDCMGGLEIQDVPSGDPIVLHQAPDEYPEPIYIMDAGGNHYAVSNASCRVQKFATAPADLGPVVGSFKTVGGVFQYVAGKP